MVSNTASAQNSRLQIGSLIIETLAYQLTVWWEMKFVLFLRYRCSLVADIPQLNRSIRWFLERWKMSSKIMKIEFPRFQMRLRNSDPSLMSSAPGPDSTQCSQAGSAGWREIQNRALDFVIDVRLPRMWKLKFLAPFLWLHNFKFLKSVKK